MPVSVIDTTVCDYNLGNQIIMDSVYSVVNELFPSEFIYKLQYLESYGFQSLRAMRSSKLTFFGGTNSLSSEMNKYSQMGFRIKDLVFFDDLVLLGVGWWQYQKTPNMYTRFLLKNLLSKKYLQSVRDEYSKKKLQEIGVLNVINTSCPTTWRLNEDLLNGKVYKKSDSVLATLTDYNKNKELDMGLMELLLKNYQRVYLWPQGVGDKRYFQELGLESNKRVEVIIPRLSAFDALCESDNIDYVGTRLHAGIRAMQYGKKSIIIGIDNRALEISKDVGISVVRRNDYEELSRLILGDFEYDLKIPRSAIAEWKNQFL